MKAEIENKINEVIAVILAKPAEDISYSEYKVLDNKYKELCYKEQQAKTDKEMQEALTKIMFKGCAIPPAPINETETED